MEPQPWLGQGCHLSTYRILYPDLIDCEKLMTLGLTLPKICSQCQLCYFGGFPSEKNIVGEVAAGTRCERDHAETVLFPHYDQAPQGEKSFERPTSHVNTSSYQACYPSVARSPAWAGWASGLGCHFGWAELEYMGWPSTLVAQLQAAQAAS